MERHVEVRQNRLGIMGHKKRTCILSTYRFLSMLKELFRFTRMHGFQVFRADKMELSLNFSPSSFFKARTKTHFTQSFVPFRNLSPQISECLLISEHGIYRSVNTPRIQNTGVRKRELHQKSNTSFFPIRITPVSSSPRFRHFRPFFPFLSVLRVSLLLRIGEYESGKKGQQNSNGRLFLRVEARIYRRRVMLGIQILTSE